MRLGKGDRNSCLMVSVRRLEDVIQASYNVRDRCASSLSGHVEGDRLKKYFVTDIEMSNIGQPERETLRSEEISGSG